MVTKIKHWYCYLKKILGFNKDDDWENNPMIIL